MMKNMRLSYWLGKIRRYGFGMLVIVVLLIVYKYTGNDEVPHNTVGVAPTRPGPTEPPLPSRWLVASSAVSSVCNHLAAEFAGWNILLTGVIKASDYSHSRCHFMKNKSDPGVNTAYAYMYAIQNGAKFIYSPPKDVKLASLELPRQLVTELHYAGLILDPPNTTNEFSADIHWGAANESIAYTNYKYCKFKVPAIQTEISVGPVGKHDTADESSRRASTSPGFDSRAPPVTLGNGLFSNISHTGTLYHRDAFWALPLVSLQPQWREIVGLFIQRFLWHIGHYMQVFAQKVTPEPQPKHQDRDRAINILLGWQCESDHLFVCAKNCLVHLVDQMLIARNVSLQLSHWFDTLGSMGYTPPLIKFGYDQQQAVCLQDPVAFFPVPYSDRIALSPTGKPYVPVRNSAAISAHYKKLCENRMPVADTMGSSGVIDFDKPWVQMDHILLIVIYNNPHYETIPYVESLYRSMFPNILYCGPGHPNSQVFASLKLFKYSFLSYHSTPKGHTPGAFNYNCTKMAINMRYNVEGYLTIADDLLLQMHSIKQLPTHVVWFIPQKEIRIGELRTLRECRLGMCDFFPHWHWWDDYRNASESAMRFLRLHKFEHPVIHKCVAEIGRLNGDESRPCGGYSDVYYIPDRKAREFVKLSEIFLTHQVFLEIAVPTMIRCLESPEDIAPLPGVQIWDESRDAPWSYYSKKSLVRKTYIHPTKWGFLARGSDEYRVFYCKQVMPHMHDKYGRLNENV